MIKSLKDLLDKLSRFTNSLVYDGGICKRLLRDILFQRLIPDYAIGKFQSKQTYYKI